MDDKVIKLFKERNLVFIATIMKDGSPQLSPVWADYENGYVFVNTAEGRIKHKNVLRDPRVAISVVDNNNPLDMTTIRGKVVDSIRHVACHQRQPHIFFTSSSGHGFSPYERIHHAPCQSPRAPLAASCL